MDSLGNIFSSRTRTELLGILAEQSLPIHLRGLADLCSVSLRAVQEAIEDLCEEALVIRIREGNKVLFALNPSHQAYNLILEIARSTKEHFLEQRSKLYSERAKSALEFASDARELFSEVRRLNS